ncbi:MAG: DNA-binding protein WhiA [Chloroflexi bacterium]|nr:MAG: DNA-binding protein WhiA [Chloroflexota bacterium]
MSFSSEVKSELSGLIPARSCCQLAELTGIFYSTRGRLIKTGNGQAAYFSLLRNTVARKVVRLSRSLAQIEAKYHAVRTAKRTAFFIELPLPAELEPAFLTPAARALPPKPCDRKNFFRGFFLGCGSVNAPSTRYHLELVAPTLGWATVLLCLLHEAQVRAGVVERAGQHVVYVKDADGIVRCLQLMGGNRAVMEFENVRVVRDVRAQVNRRINFETANIDKTIGSALRQVDAISKLEQEQGLETLPPSLREMARWRRDNPELNLSELAAQMNLSKSAVNHRLRRLVEIAEAGEEVNKTAS